MGKCGTEQSCYECPFRPDDEERHQNDSLPRIMGAIAENLRFINGELTDTMVVGALVGQGLKPYQGRVERIQKAARISGTLLCVTK